MDTLIDRFCRYVQVNTEADPNSKTYPSSPGQRELCKMLLKELHELGIKDAIQDAHGLVYATIPATSPNSKFTIAWVAHVDTAPDASGNGVKPAVHKNYDGKDIVLPGDPTKILKPSIYPELNSAKGKTIITTDGTTLLGGDDKAGVTVIMEAAKYLMSHREIQHGPIRILFTCDEEIGHGVTHVNLNTLGAHAAYTLDGGGVGEIDIETFSADQLVIKFIGESSHPGTAKGKMINAIRAASSFVAKLPFDRLSPESTEDREGFIHPHSIEGSIGEATVKLLLRDFETSGLRDKEAFVRSALKEVEREFPRLNYEITVTNQYRNMSEGLEKEPRAVKFAAEAMRKIGITPKLTIVRGGTDGSRLTEKGLPTPNLSCGQHNLHSVFEWASADEMETSVKVLIELAQIWANQK